MWQQRAAGGIVRCRPKPRTCLRMFPLPASIVSVLQPFNCLFTMPTLAHLHVLLAGTLPVRAPGHPATLRGLASEVPRHLLRLPGPGTAHDLGRRELRQLTARGRDGPNFLLAPGSPAGAARGDCLDWPKSWRFMRLRDEEIRRAAVLGCGFGLGLGAICADAFSPGIDRG